MKTNKSSPLSIMFRLVLLVSGLAAFGTLSSCHTTAGLGRDMEHAGRAIENTASETHSEMHR